MTTGYIFLLLIGLLNYCIAAASHEQFHETLVLRPNHDGTVMSSFAFTTLLEGGEPRDPRTLQEEDACKHIASEDRISQ